METFLQDVKYAVRTLARSPGFVCVAVLSLALGIGANSAIFSVVDAVLLRPLPYADADRLVMVWEDASFANFPRNTPAPANYADWKAQNRVFSDMAATAGRFFNITGDGDPERVAGRAVTANFFSLLGVPPMLGRNFAPEDDVPGASRVVIISHTLWQNRYGGERSILGRKILLNSEPFTVVGVMPPGFQFRDDERRLWVPIAFTPQQLANRGGHYLNVVARLKPGVTLAQARADIQAITERISREHQAARGLGAVVLSLREELTGDVNRPLRMVQGAVALVLLIACANLASLQLSRANARRKEIAVRSALGSGRGRIIRQLVTESMLLSLAGGATGLLLAYWSFAFLRQLIPVGLTQSTSLALSGGVLAFTVGVCLLSGLFFGLAPALQASRTNLSDALKQGDLRSGIGARGNRLRNIMVVSEVALALVLLVGAGLMVRTVYTMHSQYSALQPEGLLSVRTQLNPAKYSDPARRVAFYDQVLERVRAMPGVTAAAYTTSLPLDWQGGTGGFYPEGGVIHPGLSYDANYRVISSGYFQLVGIPVRQGRAFTEGDGASMPVVMVNETMARSYWPGENPLGRRFKLGDPDDNVPWITIVGVVADVRQMGLSQPVKAEMYFPYRQDTSFAYAARDLVIRTTAAEPLSIVGAVREQVRAVDADQPISNVRTLADLINVNSAPRRLGMTLLAGFAALALLLAAVGIYGVLAYFVSQHTQEIGVRLALGASGSNILSLVMGKGMLLAGLGVAIGLAGAWALSRLIASLLFGVSATDPATFAALAAVMLLFALLACYLPARRAMRVDPMIALRYE